MPSLKARIKMISTCLVAISDNVILKTQCMRTHVSHFSIIIVLGLLPIRLEEKKRFRLLLIVFSLKNQMQLVIIIQIKRLH